LSLERRTGWGQSFAAKLPFARGKIGDARKIRRKMIFRVFSVKVLLDQARSQRPFDIVEVNTSLISERLPGRRTKRLGILPEEV
jgi:hypothetical protein